MYQILGYLRSFFFPHSVQDHYVWLYLLSKEQHTMKQQLADTWVTSPWVFVAPLEKITTLTPRFGTGIKWTTLIRTLFIDRQPAVTENKSIRLHFTVKMFSHVHVTVSTRHHYISYHTLTFWLGPHIYTGCPSSQHSGFLEICGDKHSKIVKNLCMYTYTYVHVHHNETHNNTYPPPPKCLPPPSSAIFCKGRKII
jgi:hypothetical protein